MSGFLIRAARIAWLAGTVLTASFAANAAEPEAQNDTTRNDMVFAAQVSDTELSESRGAFLPSTFNFTNADLNAQSTQNLVVGGVTGGNLIGNGSITNTQGLVNVIQNSGNNVIIQSSTIVNLTFGK